MNPCAQNTPTAARDDSALRETASRLRKLSRAVEQSPVSIVITDREGVIEYVNPKFCAVTGYGISEIIGKNPRVLKSGEMSPETYRQMWATLVAGEEWHGEFHNRKKNGELFWETASISPLRDEEGVITHFVAVKEDSTLQKKIDAALRESEERYRSLIANARDAIFTLSVDGAFTSLNPALASLMELTCAEGEGRSFESMVHPDDFPRAWEMFQTILKGGRAPVFELRSSPLLKRPGILEVTLTPQKNEEGKIVGALGIGRDVMDRKRAQAELQEMAQRLKEHKENEERTRRALQHEHELNQVKSRFVGIVSHEFRTPLGIVNSAAHLLERYEERMTRDERVAQLHEIEHAVRRMTEMMEDLLLHEKFEAGKMECKPARVDMEALCRQQVSSAANIPGALCLVKSEIDPAAREVCVDEKIVRHILGNLISNAVKYSTDRTPVTLEVNRIAGNASPGAIPAPPSDAFLLLTVRDAGIGIPAADRDRIFQTFQRASNVGHRPGTGMGLAIVKQYVDLHHGAIRIESEEGKGTTVRVWLPIDLRLAEKRPEGRDTLLEKTRTDAEKA